MRSRPLLWRSPHSIALLPIWIWSLASTGHTPVSDPVAPSTLESTVDPAVAPGDDFFAYANGAWLKTATVPAGRDRWTVRDEINARTRAQIAAILEGARTAPAGTPARMVADVRAALLDRPAIERTGLAPLAPILARIDRVDDALALARLLGATMQADVDPLDVGTYTSASVLGLSVAHSIHGESTYTPFLVQGGLGLGDRDAYVSQEPAAVERRQRYQAYVARLLALAGFDRPEPRAAAVLAFEVALAATHATSEASAVDRNADHQWSRADFARDAPGLDWDACLDAAGLGGRPVVVAWQPSAVKGVAALVASRPLAVWKDYLRVRAIDDHADVLPAAFAEAAASMRGDTRTVEERARATTEAVMAEAIGEVYAARHFPAAQKERVSRIVADVTKTFRAHAARAAWLSPASRAMAVAKIDALYVGIGYPETREDWSDLRIDPADAFGNGERIAARRHRHVLARLGRPFDRQAWSMSPHTAGALLNFQQNAYVFAAALLQPPKYDQASSDAAAYGAIGALIGHDMSHFVDTLGADYEADGRLRHWWTAADDAAFEAAAAPLVRQFSAYEALPGRHVDGRLTRTENIADLAGLTVAFEAYRASRGSRMADRAAIRRQDREFFIAFAQTFGATMNATAMAAQLASDHAPEAFRMNTVRNLDAWYEAFDVTPGQRLHLAAADRVRVW